MAMVNLGNISAVTTQMLGAELGGVVATGVSTLLQSGGSDSLAGALNQLEKFFGPAGPGAMSGGATATGPMAFSTVAGMGGAAQSAALTNPFGATQGLQPKMQGLIEGLNQTLEDVLGRADTLAQMQGGGAQPPAGVSQADYAKQFEMVMDQAIKLHLSGNAGDGLKAQALFQKALGMLSGGGQHAGAMNAFGSASQALPAITGGGGFGAPVGGGGFGGFGASPASSSVAPAGGGVSGGGVPVTGGLGGGGGLDAMMAQAESLLRSDSMEAQLAGQRLMQKALRMFELISKLIEKQSEMASKAIAAIK